MRLVLAGVFGATLAYGARCPGADLWQGSLSLTNDYVVRGVSRSSGQAAVQLELDYVGASGFVAGVFTSDTKIDPDVPRDEELSGYLGVVWTGGSDWRGKLVADYYAYPWNAYGSVYNYGEFDFDALYRGWMDLSLSYSPSAPRFLRSGGLARGNAESMELNVQRPLVGKLSGTAGIGYYDAGSPGPTGYLYWSAGAAYDLAPVSLVLSYADTKSGANTLFYNTAARRHWIATVIWRF
jgi:uncharacterized protein (TIGR02001 family)